MVSCTGNSVTVGIKVKPRSKRSIVVGESGEFVKLTVNCELKIDLHLAAQSSLNAEEWM